MRKSINLLNKTMAFLLALLLVIPVGTIPAVMRAGAAPGTYETSDGTLVAGNYPDFTPGEKVILKSGLVKGSNYSFDAPVASPGLITVDAEAKTVTASDFTSGEYVWKPVAARVVYTGGKIGRASCRERV